MANVKWDTSDFDKGVERLLKNVKDGGIKAVSVVANEILRLSQFEVPHDTGLLQTSGHTEPGDDECIVGYNKVYAARLHEHPEYKFQKGRKGKYLEDPIKMNQKLFLEKYGVGIQLAINHK